MYDGVAGVYGADVGLVDVVPGVRVAGVDADLFFGGKAVDGNRIASAGVGAGVGGDCAAGGILGGEADKGLDPGSRMADIVADIPIPVHTLCENWDSAIKFARMVRTSSDVRISLKSFFSSSSEEAALTTPERKSSTSTGYSILAS